MKQIKFKQQFESAWIKLPNSPEQVWTKTIPETMYGYLYANGYADLFEEVEEVVTPVKETPVNVKITK